MARRMISSVLVLVSLGFFTLDAVAQGSTTYYFPQLAVGASWQTTITYINYSSEEVICTTEFLSDQGTPLMVSFAGLGTVDSRTDVLPPGGSVHQETDVDLSAPLAPGWAQATCSGPVKASLLYRLRNSEGAPTAEVGVNAAAVPATRFVTFAEQGEGQFGTGVAYANPSATSAHVTFTARDTAGEVLASVDRTLLPGGHDAHGMAELFDLTSFTGSIEVTSTEPIVSLSINLEAAPVFSSLPPGELDAAAQGSTTYYFPQLAVGASWQTTITYINYSSEEVICTTEFLSDQGTPLMVSFAGLGTVDSRTDVLPPGGSVHQETDVDLSAPLAPGWAQATCSGPVKASLLYRLRNSEGAPTAEVGVNAAAVPATRFVTFAEQGEGQFGTGVAYANPSATSAHVTFTARDTAGEVLASVDRTLLPGGHDAHGMAELFDLTSFTGSIEVTSTEPIVSLSINLEAAPVFSSLPPGDIVDTPRPPVTWVFAGDVPDAHRLALREEMEAVRTWFYEQYGVAATGFTVLVGTDSEAMTPAFNEVVGPGPIPYSPGGVQVATPFNGSDVILMDYAGRLSVNEEWALSLFQHSIAHEYFHVLQGQLISGFTQLPDGKIASSSAPGPFWLVEGLAQYADYVYTPSRPGRRAFLDSFSPYRDMAQAIDLGALTLGDLVKLEDRGNVQGGLAHPIFTYAMAFLASTLLVDQADEEASYVKYWQFLHDRPTWQQAFEDAFGIGIEDFYETFEEWLPTQLPSFAYLFISLHWPGKDALASDTLNRLRWNLEVAPDLTTLPRRGSVGWGGQRISYASGTSWTSYLSLWWRSDSCTRNLLGWYKDGELTDREAEATPVDFPGVSSSLEWALPAQPDNLPRLSQETIPYCTP